MRSFVFFGILSVLEASPLLPPVDPSVTEVPPFGEEPPAPAPFDHSALPSNYSEAFQSHCSSTDDDWASLKFGMARDVKFVDGDIEKCTKVCDDHCNCAGITIVWDDPLDASENTRSAAASGTCYLRRDGLKPLVGSPQRSCLQRSDKPAKCAIDKEATLLELIFAMLESLQGMRGKGSAALTSGVSFQYEDADKSNCNSTAGAYVKVHSDQPRQVNFTNGNVSKCTDACDKYPDCKGITIVWNNPADASKATRSPSASGACYLRAKGLQALTESPNRSCLTKGAEISN